MMTHPLLNFTEPLVQNQQGCCFPIGGFFYYSHSLPLNDIATEEYTFIYTLLPLIFCIIIYWCRWCRVVCSYTSIICAL